MLHLAIAAAGTLSVIVISEILWRGKKHSSEFIRKTIHMGVGSFIAFWPWFLSWYDIELSSLVFVLAMIAIALIKPVRKLLSISVSKSSLGRHTIGEFFYTYGFVGTAYIAHNRYIFMAAMLHLAIADTVATVLGKKAVKHNIRYKIFGSQKSLVGTLGFIVSSVVITSVYILLSHTGWMYILYVPIVAAVLENLGTYGSDNLLVPVAIALLL